MAATAEKVRKLPVPKAPKAPDVVINRVEITISMAAPFVFGVPLRLVNWLLVRLGLVTKDELAAMIEPEATVPASVAKPAAKPRTAKPRAA
jgi:hypothetical protein